ncbi:hypothetical protein, partial [Pseudomonas sp. 2995-3]|uniref:hypothetical protein n=1 Tax=Pseudomonas sp. 2995-3 TaxID=1712680 RepID=UPI001C48BA67
DNGKWIGHIIDRDILHEFFYVAEGDIPQLIDEYYSFPKEELEHTMEFHLSEENFDKLSEKGNMESVINSSSNFSANELGSFEEFIKDLEDQQWSLYNISFFETPNNNGEPLLHS